MEERTITPTSIINDTHDTSKIVCEVMELWRKNPQWQTKHFCAAIELINLNIRPQNPNV